MAEKEEVILYLQNLKAKMDVFDIVFRDDRGKNTQALLDFELNWKSRTAIIKALEWLDYSEGPKEETLMACQRCGYLEKKSKNGNSILKCPWAFPTQV